MPYRRSRSRSRGRYSDKRSRRSRSPRNRRSRSRSRGRNNYSRSPQRYRSRSPQRSHRRSRSPQARCRSRTPQRDRRGSRSPQRDRRKFRTPQRDRRGSRSPQRDRRKSHTPQRDRRGSRSPQTDLRQSAGNQNDSATSRVIERGRHRSRTPKDSEQSKPVRGSHSPADARKRKDSLQDSSAAKSSSSSKIRRSSRYSRSRSPLPGKTDSRRRRSSSPSTTLDDVLMREKPLSTKSKPSLADRYDKYDINVMCMHSKGKNRRSSAEIDDDGSSKDFFPSDVIELVHELNPKTSSSRKRSKPLFDREEIKSFVEEEVETKVIRLMPSAAELEKLEAKLSKSDSSKSKSRDSRRREDREEKTSRESRTLLRREPERRRYHVTDDDLLDIPPPSSSRMDIEKDSKRSIQDRLGSSVNDREDRYKRIDDRLGRLPDTRDRRDDRVSATDLRHNLTSRHGRDFDSRQAPLVRDYGHRSLTSDVERPREPTPDFSKRPDKGKIDMMELDPTYVPRGGLYDQHDDRTRDRGDWRGRGRGYRGRGGYRNPNFRRDDRNDRGSRNPRAMDRRLDKRKPIVGETWKHDKFDELEDETKVEPTSTTA